MRIPPNPPPGPSDYSGQNPIQQMENDILSKLQELHGEDATLQSPGDGSSYSNDLMRLIDRFTHAKNWQQAENAYQAIMLKLEDGPSDGSSQTPHM